jgi:hypothetical protein
VHSSCKPLFLQCFLGAPPKKSNSPWKPYVDSYGSHQKESSAPRHPTSKKATRLLNLPCSPHLDPNNLRWSKHRYHQRIPMTQFKTDRVRAGAYSPVLPHQGAPTKSDECSDTALSHSLKHFFQCANSKVCSIEHQHLEQMS